MSPRTLSSAERLREQVQRFVRGFGLLAEEQTPCGAPVSPREAHALLVVLERERAGAPLVQTELASTLGIDKSNVTRLVQRLRKDDRVEQVTSEHDARARCLRLTARGRRLAEALERSSRERFERLLGGIPMREQRAVLAALSRLNEALAADLAPNADEETSEP